MPWSYILVFGGIALLLRSLYRLFFHPLSHIPGPRLAAITHAVEFYHDVVGHGTYIWEIAKMHEKYGEISLSWFAVVLAQYLQARL